VLTFWYWNEIELLSEEAPVRSQGNRRFRHAPIHLSTAPETQQREEGSLDFTAFSYASRTSSRLTIWMSEGRFHPAQAGSRVTYPVQAEPR
jgi:hypothetical protein